MQLGQHSEILTAKEVLFLPWLQVTDSAFYTAYSARSSSSRADDGPPRAS